jgi:hypothetical protein
MRPLFCAAPGVQKQIPRGPNFGLARDDKRLPRAELPAGPARAAAIHRFPQPSSTDGLRMTSQRRKGQPKVAR